MPRRLLASAVVIASFAVGACGKDSTFAPVRAIRPSLPSMTASQWSVGGKIVGMASTNIDIFNDDGSNEDAPGIGGWYPAFSPDGQRIAYAQADASGNPTLGLYVMNSDGTNPVQIAAPSVCSGGFPRWSPSGARIAAFCGSVGYAVVDVASGSATPIPGGCAAGRGLDWSPDGTRIACVRLVGSNYAITLLNPDGSNPVDVYQSSPLKRLPRFSPDGAKIAFEDMSTNPHQIWVIDVNGSNPVRVWSAGEYPMWSPNGSCVGFLSRVSNFGVHCVRLDGTGDEQLIPVALTFSDWWAPRAPSDGDSDGIADGVDNCPTVANSSQTNTDGDTLGDACDPDDDNDGVSDATEVAAGSNPLNAASTPEVCDGVDNDLDGQTDETCDADSDGVIDARDNCPNVSNSNQINTDGDAMGDACDPDDDNDGFTDAAEVTAGSNPLSAASTPEVCDGVDNDKDGQTDEGFTNTDGDAQANCVDLDDDNDGLADAVDDAPLTASTHFTWGNTAGTVLHVPPGLQWTISANGPTNGVSIIYSLSAPAAPGEYFRIAFDRKHFMFDDHRLNCVASPCASTVADPPAQLQVAAIHGITDMSATLNGAETIVTVLQGSIATITEYSSNGVLTDATVSATGPAGGVLVNGLPLPVGVTTVLGVLSATTSVSGGKAKSVSVNGTFTQSALSNGFDPLTEEVTVRVGPYTWIIAARSFTAASDGAYGYAATVNGVQLSIQLKRTRGSQWSVKVNATSVTGITVPAPIGLRIGNDAGVTSG